MAEDGKEFGYGVAVGCVAIFICSLFYFWGLFLLGPPRENWHYVAALPVGILAFLLLHVVDGLLSSR